MHIIGYIHVCQLGDWRRSFRMLINAVKQSQLYDNVNIIRIGVVNNAGKLINDPLLQDAKFELMYLGSAAQYERPTLLNMRARAGVDPADTFYFYLHTKGIKHFGNPGEINVIGWINLMLFWNIFRWQYATTVLNTYSVYGCEYTSDHFSGNFWWATAKHIQRLPRKIESHYIAPEQWVTLIKDKVYSAYCSEYAGGGLYGNYLDPKKYMHLSNTDAYKTNLVAYNKRVTRRNIKIAKMNKYNTMVGTIMSNQSEKTSTLSNVSRSSTLSNTTKPTTLSNVGAKQTKSSTVFNIMSKPSKSTTLSNVIAKPTITVSNVNKLTKVNTINTINTMSNTNRARASTVSNATSNKNTKFTLSNIMNK